MSWYYAGPDAKPVGPLTVEELHDRRVSGAVSPETYVIEHTGQPVENWAWKRYREVFPTNLPPVPPPAVAPPPRVPIPPVPPILSAGQPHPLFPSAATPGHSPVFSTPAGPDPYYRARPTNSLCAWGFVLGLIGLFLSIFCIGWLLALPSLFLCISGLVQLHKNPQQAGRGLAIAGLILSAIALLISLLLICYFAVPAIKAHELTVTEQTSTDSE